MFQFEIPCRLPDRKTHSEGLSSHRPKRDDNDKHEENSLNVNNVTENRNIQKVGLY